MHAPSPRTRRVPAGFLGGCVGAAAALTLVSLGDPPRWPSTATAAQQVVNDDADARGFISAADQRKQIIERLDKVIGALERIDRRLNAGVPTTTAAVD